MLRNFTKYYINLLAVLFIVGLFVGCTSNKEHAALIKQALTIMKADAAKLGAPSVVADSLFFGTTKINDNFEITDKLHEKYGCTATFFLKQGDDFIRISTNVMIDGKRALGTPLDPKGPVIKQLLQGKAFNGVVDILGDKFESGYEPIKNAAGEVIGVYYVGFQI